MSLPRRLACRLWGRHILGLALAPALALTSVGCAVVREGAPGGGADAAMDAPATTPPIVRDAVAEISPAPDAPADQPRPGADGGAECTEAGNCLVGCGNGKLDPGLGEACDDGNSVSGDGCAANCATIDKDYTCPQPGEACVYLVKCGDGRLGGKETCDDGNAAGNDGCSATCTIEAGWDCGQPGHACTAHCGDGVLKAAEQCEPPNPGKGCSAACRIEPGYVCAPPPATPMPSEPAKCHKSVCGDGVKEGAEACDDKNVIDGDGCSATCTLEPDCSTGLCASKCGDGLKLAPEGCDDGNVVDGDGCTKACTLETGYTCTDSSGAPPASLNLAATYRDFISFPAMGTTRHPDFERFWGDDVTPLLVKTMLGPTGKPVMDGRCVAAGQTAICPKGQQLTTSANFDQWYTDVPNVNITIPGSLLLPRLADGSYVYDSANVGFFPIDKKGWTAAPIRENNANAEAGVNDGLPHNFGFTTEIRYFFQYRGGESLTFSGDDDVWIFVNRRLAMDLGGLHPPIEKTLDVDASAAALGLTVGGLYEVVLFHAERHTAGSNFKLTLTGFAPVASTCGPRCGDGVVIAPEECDLGADMNTGQYNGCTAECRRGPSCGDAMVQMPEEQCDDGVNLTLYGQGGAPGCAPGCVHSGFCGDAKVDGVFGEQCDLGTEMNTGQYNGCLPTCLLGPRCGDAMLQKDGGEECDDGNTVGADGCTHDCKIEYIP